jgi:hypothetical protein
MRLVFAVILLAVLAGSGAVAGAPEKKKAKEKKEDKQEVITNETLKRKYGEPEPARPPREAGRSEAPPEPAPPKPAMTEPERSKRIAELGKEQVRLQRRIQSLKNPFLPRVPLTEEEQKAEEGKGADERVRMLEERLARIGHELKELEEPPGRSR